MTARRSHISDGGGSEREPLDADLSILLEVFRAPFLHLRDGMGHPAVGGRREPVSSRPNAWGFDPAQPRGPVDADRGASHRANMN